MFISGAIIPVGVKNKNGWGILDSEIQNVVNTLKEKVLTVCPRSGDAHACDFDPKAEIGRVSDVWYDPFSKKIRAMAKITDSVAERKIAEGTWKPNWSVRLAAGKNEAGWVSGVEGQNITLVPEGAWPDANFNVLASKETGFEAHLIASFDIAPAPSEPSKSEVAAPITLGTVNFVPTANTIGNNWVISATLSSGVIPEPEKDNNLVGGKKMGDEVSNITVEQHTAALAERDQKISDLEKKVADFTAGQADAIAVKAKEIAEAQITAYKASLARDSAIQEYVTASTARGVKEVDVKMFDGMTAEQIGVFTAALKAIPVATNGDGDENLTAGLKYPALSPEENGKLSVGVPEIQPDGSVVWKV